MPNWTIYLFVLKVSWAVPENARSVALPNLTECVLKWLDSSPMKCPELSINSEYWALVTVVPSSSLNSGARNVERCVEDLWWIYVRKCSAFVWSAL